MKNLKQMIQNLAKLFAAFLLAILIMSGSCDSNNTGEIHISKLDFNPIYSNSYNPGCSHDHMIYNQDAKLFYPVIELDKPAPDNTNNVFFYIKEESGATIGYFKASIQKGERRFSSFITPSNEEEVEEFLGVDIKRMPVGAPKQETRGFWLGCTKKCILRGNGPKGNAGAQNVYLYLGNKPQWLIYEPSMIETIAHRIECS